MQKLPGQEQKAGGEQGHVVVLGAEDAEQLSPMQEGNALFRAYAIENADPKSSQMHVRLLKAKGSWKCGLTKGSLTTVLTFFFKLTFLCEAGFQKFAHDPLL